MLGLVLISCSDEGTGPGGSTDSTVISGALAATDGRTGVLSLESTSGPVASRSGPVFAVSASAAGAAELISLTGTATLSDGTTADLTGTWDTETGEFSVSGGGFVFEGVIEGGSLTGDFTGPDIEGIYSIQVGAPSDLAVYCGTFNGLQLENLPDGNGGVGPSNGTWNLVVGASTVQLIAVTSEGTPIVADGTRSGATVTIGVPGQQGATGTIAGDDEEFVNGDYNVSVEDVGEFHGSKAACTATSETGTIASLVLNPPGLTPGNGRLAFDSTLAFVTALDADGNYVAAPELTWSLLTVAQAGSADPQGGLAGVMEYLRTNDQSTLPGQKWVVAQSPEPPVITDPDHIPDFHLHTRTFTVTSVNNPSVSATGTVVVYWYW
jgi:hypothetical protein